MWIVIALVLIIIAILMIALLRAYVDLSSKVEILKNTINWQNERYMSCIKGWGKTIKLINEAISLNEDMRNLNKRLYAELYNNKEANNNECE